MVLLKYWKPFPFLDTSGGNVAFSCLSLVELLKFNHITIFGADFAYKQSKTYARGTYIYPYFEKRQNRLSPLEALHSTFLYRSPFLPPANPAEKQIFYETSQLRFYKEKFAEKLKTIKTGTTHQTPGKPSKIIPWKEFIQEYSHDVTALPAISSGDYISNLNKKELEILFTLLPLAAALKKRNPELKPVDLLEETKRYIAQQIEMYVV